MELVRGVCSVFSGLCQEHISQDQVYMTVM